MSKPAYIGVTGFMTPQEVRAGLQYFTGSSWRKLMVGVLASSKTLTGRQDKWPGRYPAIDRIGEIFQSHPAVLNLIHYHTDLPTTLSSQLVCLTEVAGERLHGFQLNIAWPEVQELYAFHAATDWKYRIVLQIGGGAMAKAEHSPEKLADMIARYCHPLRIIDDVLIDPSGGHGQPFDAEKARVYLREIVRRGHDINVGVAGGLGPDTTHLFKPLLREFPRLNIDAEGKLRVPGYDDLDVVKMTGYLNRSLELMHAAAMDNMPME